VKLKQKILLLLLLLLLLPLDILRTAQAKLFIKSKALSGCEGANNEQPNCAIGTAAEED